MATHRTNALIPSVLDRLISSASSGEIGSVRSGSSKALRLSVERDLNALLNTRRGPDLIPGEFQAASASLLNYGLPDIASYNLGGDPQGLRRDIETAIRTFEPRLSGVTVSVEDWDRFSPVLKFHIRATLRTGPVPEGISFATVFQADLRSLSVKARAE
jgi:type VI secretion system protein ImpF